MKARIKHRLTLVQDIELPPDLAAADLEAFLRKQHQLMAQNILEQIERGSHHFTHKLRSVTPGRGFELLMQS